MNIPHLIDMGEDKALQFVLRGEVVVNAKKVFVATLADRSCRHGEILRAKNPGQGVQGKELIGVGGLQCLLAAFLQGFVAILDLLSAALQTALRLGHLRISAAEGGGCAEFAFLNLAVVLCSL